MLRRNSVHYETLELHAARRIIHDGSSKHFEKNTGDDWGKLTHSFQ